MAQCRKIPGIKRQVCIGSMDKLITLKGRSIKAPASGSVDYSEDFTDIGALSWANVQTLQRGPIMFDRTNIARQITHIFKIRYRGDVTAQAWIEYENINYDILNVEDLEERHDYLFLYAIRRGVKTLPINQV
jgi:head-tail adaptor